MRFGPIVVGVALLAAAACDDKSSGGGPPTTPTPTPTGLAITGTETLRTGQAQTYTATLTLSNGTTQSATPTWTSDNSGVLAINASGQANAASQGTATITASAQGQTATRTVTVYQDYQGTWTGTYRVRVCTDKGDFRGSCDLSFTPGTLLPIRITLTQNAASASGTLELGTIVSNVSGSIFSSRRFVGGGSGTYSDFDELITINVSVGTLDVLSTATNLTGSVIVTISSAAFSGNMYVEADLASVTRTSSLAEPRSTPPLHSMKDLIRALQAR